jgi:DNA polymerase/3'-5' exonuclease PolX
MPGEDDPARYRRVDLVFCTAAALPFCTLQWTGSDGGLFNREIKRLAAFHGFHLSNTFVCRADREFVRGRNVGEIARCGPCIECANEEAIFKAIGVPYRMPDQRKVDAEMLAAVATAAKMAPTFRQAAREALDLAQNKNFAEAEVTRNIAESW